MSTPLLFMAFILLAFLSFFSGVLFGGSGSRNTRETALLVFVSMLMVVGFASTFELQKGRATGEYVRWESLEAGPMYWAPVYINNGEKVIAVVERDGILQPMEIPFTPHSAYLQVHLDQNGNKKLVSLTRTTNSLVITRLTATSRRAAVR